MSCRTQENIYVYQFIIESTTQKQTWKRLTGQGMGAGVWSFHALSGYVTLICSPSWKLSKSHCSEVFIEFNRQPPLPSQVVGWGWKSQLSQHLVFLQTSSVLRLSWGPTLSSLALMCDGKRLIMTNKRHCHSGNSRSFMSSVPGTVDKGQIYFFLYHSGKHLKLLETFTELWTYASSFSTEPKPCLWSYEA